MPVIPNPSNLRNLLFYAKMGLDLLVFFIICRVMVYIITVTLLILAIKYAAYIPDNPNWKHNFDDVKSAPANPFTEAPKTYHQPRR